MARPPVKYKVVHWLWILANLLKLIFSDRCKKLEPGEETDVQVRQGYYI